MVHTCVHTYNVEIYETLNTLSFTTKCVDTVRLILLSLLLCFLWVDVVILSSYCHGECTETLSSSNCDKMIVQPVQWLWFILQLGPSHSCATPQQGQIRPLRFHRTFISPVVNQKERVGLRSASSPVPTAFSVRFHVDPERIASLWIEAGLNFLFWALKVKRLDPDITK